MSEESKVLDFNKNVKDIEPVKLDFYSAIREVVEGKKIHKLEWGDKEFYGLLDNDILKLHKPDGKLYQWVISFEDIIGEDYIVVDGN